MAKEIRKGYVALAMNTIRGILGNKCPRCGTGAVFSGIYSMHPRCSSCGLLYANEPGYFMGAMAASYFIGASSAVVVMLICFFGFHLPIWDAVAIAVVEVLVTNPLIFRYSRLVWLYVERRFALSLDGKEAEDVVSPRK